MGFLSVFLFTNFCVHSEWVGKEHIGSTNICLDVHKSVIEHKRKERMQMKTKIFTDKNRI